MTQSLSIDEFVQYLNFQKLQKQATKSWLSLEEAICDCAVPINHKSSFPKYILKTAKTFKNLYLLFHIKNEKIKHKLVSHFTQNKNQWMVNYINQIWKYYQLSESMRKQGKDIADIINTIEDHEKNGFKAEYLFVHVYFWIHPEDYKNLPLEFLYYCEPVPGNKGYELYMPKTEYEKYAHVFTP